MLVVMVYDVLVVGAGPAGLFAAIAAAGAGARVLVLEGMPNPGRKLLASGSGQCNLTHGGELRDFLAHYGSSSRVGASRFLRPSLYGFSNRDLASFAEDRGVPLEATEGGKVFPVSRRAKDVRDLLLREAQGLGAELWTGARLRDLRRLPERFDAEIERREAEREVLSSSSVVLATGGASWPATGSTGDGYALAAALGHHIVEPGPALTSVQVQGAAFAPFVSCAGLALPNAPVTVIRGGQGKRPVARGAGAVLFTHRGLSGPGVLDLSRAIRPGDTLLLPLADLSQASAAGAAKESGNLDGVDARLREELDAHGKRGIVRVLSSFGLAESLARALLQAHGMDVEIKAALLSREKRRSLAASLALPGHPFPVASLGGWEEAMATRGGVDLDEVDSKTMESRLVPGLYFAGELLDFDGDSGGYNIQAACSTGRLAGASAAREAHKSAKKEDL